MVHAEPEPPRTQPTMRPLGFHRRPPDEMAQTARELAREMAHRRSVREFSTDPVPASLVEQAIAIASSAPSGAHRQPWTFVMVSDPEVRQQLRDAAEEEERAFYDGRAPQDWLDALAPLGTDAVKAHLTDAPHLIVLFRHRYLPLPDGARGKNYYSTESCGIAAGFLIMALHQIGLATLPHTPSPMGFLAEVLGRPEHEQAYLVLPVGYPAADAAVPDIERKPMDEVLVRV